MSSITPNMLSLSWSYSVTGAGLGAAFALKASPAVCTATTALGFGVQHYNDELDIYELINTGANCIFLMPAVTLALGAVVGGTAGLIIGATRHIFQA